MAVVHFKETTGRRGSEDFETHREAVRTFQALTDHPRDGQEVVRDHVGVPRRGDVYQYLNGAGVYVSDNNMRCVRVHVSQDDEDCFENWKVVAEYRGINDPTFEPPDVKWGTHSYQAARLKDLTSPTPQVYKNSAGDPFEGGRLVDADRFTLTIVRNVVASAWNPITIAPFQNSLNDRTFMAARHPPGFAAGTCKLKLSADLVWYPGSKTAFYWRRTAVIEYRPETWAGKVRDSGFRAIQDGKWGGDPVPIPGKNGIGVTTPQLLDGTGRLLAVGGTPVELTFVDYPSKNWTPLDLEY